MEERFRGIEDKLNHHAVQLSSLTLVKEYMINDLHEVKESVEALTSQLHSINMILTSSQGYLKGAVYCIGVISSICTLVLAYLALK